MRSSTKNLVRLEEVFNILLEEGYLLDIKEIPTDVGLLGHTEAEIYNNNRLIRKLKRLEKFLGFAFDQMMD
jgi:hypothetical protein